MSLCAPPSSVFLPPSFLTQRAPRSAPAAADRSSKNKPCFGGKECVAAAQSGDCKVGSQPDGSKKSPWRGGDYYNTAKACERFTNQWENVRAFEVRLLLLCDVQLPAAATCR